MSDYIDLTEEKNKLIDFVANMNLYDGKDYEILKSMLLVMEPTLFVKIIEEMKDNNLSLKDFYRLFESTNYGETIANSLENQANLYDEYTRLISLLLDYHIIEEGDKLNNLVTFATVIVNNKKYSVAEVEKIQKIFELYIKDTNDQYKEFFKDKIFSDFLKEIQGTTVNVSALDNILLSMQDYLVPVDYRYIELTDDDKNYAYNNKLTTDQMKKLKSMYAYYSTLNDTENDN